MAETAWDRVVDVVVVGSGAGALTAAAAAAEGGCIVEVLEKADLVGGTSAFSGGMAWVPCNSHMAEAGVDDSREDALTYVRGLTQGREPDPRLLEVFVDRAGEAFDFVEAHTAARFSASRNFSDYFGDHPGGKRAARSLDTAPFPARRLLGVWEERVRTTPHMVPGLTQDELVEGGIVLDPRNAYLDDTGDATRRLLAERRAEGITSLGVGLIGGLLRGVLDLGAVVTTGARVRRLVMDGTAVAGVVVEQGGEERTIGARRGVVLASGGFEWNPDLVRAYIGALDLRPLSPPTNVGDGLVMAIEAGAALANMTQAWGYPVTSDGTSTLEGAPLSIMQNPRQEPGCVVVNREGRRFGNEGVTYMDFRKRHADYDTRTQSYPNEAPVWLVFDQRVRDRIHSGDLHPGEPTPAWIHEAGTLAELAGHIGADPQVLEAEIARFNAHVDAGHDPDFGRGTVWWEGWTSGGPAPEKSLARIDRAPYFAMPLFDGVLGTAGGPLVDEHAQVRALRGGVVPGLYAAGNVAAGAFGPMYPGGGATLGLAMTFGYVAGRSLAAEDARPVGDAARRLEGAAGD